MIPLLLIACLGADPLPLVVEHYSQLVVVREIGDPQGWNATQVYFVRDGKAIASRSVEASMLWAVRDGQLALVWEDYGNVSRIVTCDAVVCVEAKRRVEDEMVWWAAGRAMTDLRMP